MISEISVSFPPSVKVSSYNFGRPVSLPFTSISYCILDAKNIHISANTQIAVMILLIQFPILPEENTNAVNSANRADTPNTVRKKNIEKMSFMSILEIRLLEMSTN